MPLSRKTAFGVALMHATQSMSTDIYIVALPLIGLYFNAPLLAVQATMLSFVFGLSFAHLFIGRFADFYGRRPVIFAGLAFYILTTIYAILAPSVTHLIFARFLQGMATACGPIVMRAIVRDLVTPQQTSQAFALTGLIAAFGPILAPSLGSLAVEWGGWRMSLVALLFYAGFVLLYNVFTLPETLREENRAATAFESPFSAVPVLFKSSAFLRGAALIFLGYGGLYAWLSTGSYILIDHLHYGQRETGVFIGLGAVCFLMGTFLTNLLLKHVAVRAILVGAGGMGIVGSAISLWLLAHQPSFLVLFLSVMPFYIGWGMMQPISMATAMRPFAAIAGQASAWFGIAQFMGAMTIAFFAGLWGAGSATFAMMLCAMFGIFMIGVYWPKEG